MFYVRKKVNFNITKWMSNIRKKWALENRNLISSDIRNWYFDIKIIFIILEIQFLISEII